MMQYMDITPWAGEFHGKCHYVDGVFRLAWAYIIAPLACHLGIKKLSAEQPMKEASARERWVIIFLQAGLEWLREIYSEDELLSGTLNDNWRALMAFQLERARDWFARSEAGVRWLAPDARWPVWTSLRLYRGILDAIERLNYDVFNHRAYVPRVGKLMDLPLSYLIAQAR